MSDRWIPIIAAVLGLLGGIGGTAIGGYIANEGEQDRLHEQRRAELNGLLIATDSRYVRTAASTYALLTTGEPSEIQQSRALGELEAGDSEVSFAADDQRVKDAADALEQAVIDREDGSIYRQRRDRFIKLAGESLIPERELNE